MIVGKLSLSLLLIAALVRPEASLFAAEIGPVVQPSSLCRSEEEVIFTCVAAGSAKFVSLCGSRLLDHRRGYLQYRYGKPGAIELQFPQARANTQLAFRYAHYFRPQVDRTEISFDNQDSRYILFDYYDGDVKPVVAVAGVRVGKLGTKGRETELRCQSRPASKLGSLETVVRRDHDNALNW
jgi:hypothetical protein